ncbi:hypothetical protein PRUPE_3G015800 [Prunus persica]|uniref:Uncharacterized protein n=1 Tax=Prunus persica TaxID=3760 RepID=A0A251PTM6_PRUPE|nr:hypothetical protein PRUPE_3G015800 [Prunus persica]ONI14917.1 hypothetical protein PRUPE_3G015800 [Prunus persica]
MTRHCVSSKVACARTKRETNRCELLTKYTNIMEDLFYVGVRATSFAKGIDQDF